MFSRARVVRAELRKSASINRVLWKDTRVIDDRSIAPRYPRGVLRILPITASVIDIEPRGGYRLDTIDSAPGVSPAWTIYNVNIPEPGSTLFSRPFSFLFVLFYLFYIPCLSCAATTSREGKRPIIPCISKPGLTRDDIGWIEFIIIKGSSYN